MGCQVQFDVTLRSAVWVPGCSETERPFARMSLNRGPGLTSIANVGRGVGAGGRDRHTKDPEDPIGPTGDLEGDVCGSTGGVGDRHGGCLSRGLPRLAIPVTAIAQVSPCAGPATRPSTPFPLGGTLDGIYGSKGSSSTRYGAGAAGTRWSPPSREGCRSPRRSR